MEYILPFLVLYYVILISLTFFVTKKYKNINLWHYFTTIFVIFVIIVVYFSMIDMYFKPTNCLNKVDFLEIESIVNNKSLSENRHIFSEFISLFTNSHNSCRLNVELKNTYYINNLISKSSHSGIERLDFYNMYTRYTQNNKEILFFFR